VTDTLRENRGGSDRGGEHTEENKGSWALQTEDQAMDLKNGAQVNVNCFSKGKVQVKEREEPGGGVAELGPTWARKRGKWPGGLRKLPDTNS